MWLLRFLNDDRLTNTAATAQCGQTSFQAPLFHFMDKADHDPATSIAYGMAEGNTTSVHIYDLPIQTEFPLNSHRRRGKGLVYFNKFDVLKLIASLFKKLLNCRDRPNAHNPRIYTNGYATDYPPLPFHIQPVRKLSR